MGEKVKKSMDSYSCSGLGFESRFFDPFLKLPETAFGRPEVLLLAAKNVATERIQTRKAFLRGFKLAEDLRKLKFKLCTPLEIRGGSRHESALKLSGVVSFD